MYVCVCVCVCPPSAATATETYPTANPFSLYGDKVFELKQLRSPIRMRIQTIAVSTVNTTQQNIGESLPIKFCTASTGQWKAKH